MKRVVLCFALAISSFLLLGPIVFAQQGLTLPRPSQLVSTTQTIGLSTITVEYSSPSVQGRDLWGQLVPMGQVWRAGANENTIISFSHDAKVNGSAIKAGTYGLHAIPGEKEWTIIFSNNSTSWGSFSYDQKEDALRITTESREGSQMENLTFLFGNPSPASVDVILAWGKKQVPFTVAFDSHEIVLASMRNELRSTPGFTWVGFQQAANYCLQNEINYEEALGWINQSISGGFGAQANFTNLQTKSQLLAKMGKADESETAMKDALNVGSNMELYQYGASLIGQNQNEKALEVFKLNAEKYPGTWLSHGGLGAGYRVTGNYKEALKHYKKSKESAPSAWVPSIEQRIAQVEEAMAK